jgi:hypothetical protein
MVVVKLNRWVVYPTYIQVEDEEGNHLPIPVDELTDRWKKKSLEMPMPDVNTEGHRWCRAVVKKEK